MGIVDCPDCDGPGLISGRDGKCSDCHGTGYEQDVVEALGKSLVGESQKCETCGGNRECQTCYGKGYLDT